MKIEKHENGHILSVTIFGVTFMKERRYRLLKNIIMLVEANKEMRNQSDDGFDYKIGGF